MTTTMTERVLRAACERGFRISTRAHGGRLVYLLNQPGEEGTFGVLYVGARSGRITGAILHRGNNDLAGTRYRGACATGQAIRETPGRAPDGALDTDELRRRKT